MFYEYSIAVPANTTEADPVEQQLPLALGIIHRVEVQFPAGCAGLVHVRLEHHSFGHLPTNPDGNFASDDYTIPVDENLNFAVQPFSVKAILWNTDGTYSHTITLRFGIFESKSALFFMSVLEGMAKMLKYLGIKV